MRALPFLLVTALLAPVLAGCLGADAPEPAALPPQSAVRFDGELLERLSIPLPDGVRLDASVLRPETDEPVPVLVDIGPYYGNLAGETYEFSGFDERLAEFFVPRGYAVARASLRGTGASEGCFTLGDEQERKDIHGIVEFLAAEPWSNGNVAVIGKSYDGTTAWQAAVAAPPSLKTVVPISGITDMYRYMFFDGTAYGHGPIFNTYYGLLVDWDTYPFAPAYYGGHEEQNLARTCSTEFPVQVAEGLETGFSGDHDAFWDARDYTPLMENVRASVFLVHGLQDWNVKPDHSIPVFNDLAVPKKAWLGQWAHDYPDINRYNEAWSRSDWNETLLQWFDHFLKGMENGALEGPVVEVQDPEGAWRNETAWPPARTVLRPLFPGHGALNDQGPSALGSPHTFVADPWNEPTHEGPVPSGIRFATAPLPEDLRVAGAPRLTAFVSADRPAANLAVTLYDVDPNGTWHEVDWGFLDLRHRNSRDAGEPVVPGEVMEVTVNLYPQDLVFREGHRVGVLVSGEKPSWILPAKGAPASYALHTTQDRPTALWLPVLPEADGDLWGYLELGHAWAEGAEPPEQKTHAK